MLSDPQLDPAPAVPNIVTTDRILYLSLLASHGVYAALALYLPGAMTTGEAASKSLALPVAILALATAAAALALDALGFSDTQIDKWIDEADKKFPAREEAAAFVRQRAMPLSLMRWSIASFASMMGLFVALTGAMEKKYALLFIALGALVHLYCQPKMARINARIADRHSTRTP